MEESFYREEPIATEQRTLPAAIYNLAHTLLAQSGRDCLFVPIRSMQYLAVLDREEFIFVDREGGRLIEIAWQHFDPHGRNALADPVPYEAVYYLPQAMETMKRIPSEFHKALQVVASRRIYEGPAKVLKLKKTGASRRS